MLPASSVWLPTVKIASNHFFLKSFYSKYHCMGRHQSQVIVSVIPSKSKNGITSLQMPKIKISKLAVISRNYTIHSNALNNASNHQTSNKTVPLSLSSVICRSIFIHLDYKNNFSEFDVLDAYV